MSDDAPEKTTDREADRKSRIADAAQRALAEAEARRGEQTDSKAPAEKELGGRDGPEPTRFGDWEKKGLISDF